MTTTTFTAYEVAAMTGAVYRTMMKWVERGLLNPEGARRGHRRPTTWHEKDVREAAVLSACRKAGYSLQGLRRAIEYLRSLGHNPLSTGTFVAVRTGNGDPAELVKICDDGEALALIRQPGQVVLPLWPIEGNDDS